MSDSIHGLERLYTAIGYLVTQWSMIDQSLDLCVAAIFPRPEVQAIEADVPATTNRKTQFLRQALLTLPGYRPFADRGVEMLDRLAGLKDRRHDLLHSVLADVEDEDGVYSYISLKPMGAFPAGRPWKFDLNAFPELRHKLGVLAADLQQFAHDLVHIEVAHAGPLRPVALRSRFSSAEPTIGSFRNH